MCTGAETQRQKMDADRCDWSDRDVDGDGVDGMLLFRQHIHDSTAWHFDTARSCLDNHLISPVIQKSAFLSSCKRDLQPTCGRTAAVSEAEQAVEKAVG